MMLSLLATLLACSPDEPVATVDVVVVGAGGAGVSAGMAAVEAGAEVLVLEREAEPGGSSDYGGTLWAADSRLMRDAGVADSVEQAIGEWPELTAGGWVDPTVEAFVGDSAAVVEWLVDDLGSPFTGVTTAAAAGGPARAHHLGFGGNAAIHLLLDALEAEVWTGCTATGLVWEGEALDGVRCECEGEDGVEAQWVRARAVVVATGGFARDLDLVYGDRPGMEGIPLIFDHAPGVDGGGHPLMEGTDAGWANRGGMAVYVHGVEDWRSGREGELVLVHALEHSAVVSPAGRRVGNEWDTKGFAFSDHLEAHERLVALYPRVLFESRLFLPRVYDEGPRDGFEAEALYEAGRAVASTELAELAASLDVDLAGLQVTVDEVELAVATGVDPSFDKPGSMFTPFDGDYAAVELRGATAKAFSGWRTDAGMRVLTSDHEPVPGLYGAGEAIGFLGTDAVGRGFTGSMTAVYWTGLRAGEGAAGFALDR